MKKTIIFLGIWTLLILTVIEVGYINNQSLLSNKKAPADDVVYEKTGVAQVTGINTTINDIGIAVPDTIRQYRLGANFIGCTEALSFRFVNTPGASNVEVLDASQTDRTEVIQDNTIVAGQGFNADVIMRATISGANCTSASNLSTFKTKLTKNRSPLQVTFTPSENITQSYTDAKTIRYIPNINSIIDLPNGFQITYSLPDPYLDPETGETTYASGGSNWQQLTKYKGSYYTNLSTCPKNDAMGNPLPQYYAVEYQYDRTDGLNLINTTTQEPEFEVRYGQELGRYYVAQQLLIASSASACRNNDDKKMVNNFYYTQVNYNNPFTNVKFDVNELLNWKMWNFDLSSEENWRNISLATEVIDTKEFDFNSEEGIAKLQAIKRLYEEDKMITFDGYSPGFRPYTN